ncbi:MAG: hypothetical protein ABI367_00620 [Mucilaginibacter sp.]
MEKPIKHLYFEVLEYLANEGIGVDTNIKDLCLPYVNKSREEETIMDDALDAFGKSWSRVMSVLGTLERQGYIKYSNEHADLQQLYIVDGNFSASITKDGFEYYSTRVLREATIQSYKNQNWYNWGAVIIAGGSLLTTVIFGLHANHEKELLSHKLDSLSKEVTHIKAMIPPSYPTHKTVDTISKKRPKTP